VSNPTTWFQLGVIRDAYDERDRPRGQLEAPDDRACGEDYHRKHERRFQSLGPHHAYEGHDPQSADDSEDESASEHNADVKERRLHDGEGRDCEASSSSALVISSRLVRSLASAREPRHS